MKNFLILLLMLLFITPANAATFYDTYGGIDNVLNKRILSGFKNAKSVKVLSFVYNDSNQIAKIYTNFTWLTNPVELTYDDNGKLSYYDVFKVKYDKDGKILKLSPLDKVLYNDKGQVIQIGKFHIIYDKSGSISKLCRNTSDFEGEKEYYPYYNLIDDNFKICYEKMIADSFFNKYKSKIKKYNTYNYFRNDIEIALQDCISNSEVKNYTDLIDKFNKIYTDYISFPHEYNLLSENDKVWFLEQIKQTENWMKTHNSNYENYYENQYKVSARVNEKILSKTKTESELLKEEISGLKSEISELKKSNSELKRKQPEKIYSIGGKRVQYSGDRIYSIGGERVRY